MRSAAEQILLRFSVSAASLTAIKLHQLFSCDLSPDALRLSASHCLDSRSRNQPSQRLRQARAGMEHSLGTRHATGQTTQYQLGGRHCIDSPSLALPLKLHDI